MCAIHPLAAEEVRVPQTGGSTSPSHGDIALGTFFTSTVRAASQSNVDIDLQNLTINK